ncbi:hypothetical protein CCACVL1_18596 [Corchorus capsularis]|uniref:Uncharacterized protein n=1 Tax=Corchorus capsularis TaxID=210143 RepID=A0A1R3HKS8_COCAP|nr:hypothetical protein CCACVL1_18596 [Corchorus capsularis]
MWEPKRFSWDIYLSEHYQNSKSNEIDDPSEAFLPPLQLLFSEVDAVTGFGIHGCSVAPTLVLTTPKVLPDVPDNSIEDGLEIENDFNVLSIDVVPESQDTLGKITDIDDRRLKTMIFLKAKTVFI